MKKLHENTKVTLTLSQLKRLVKEAKSTSLPRSTPDFEIEDLRDGEFSDYVSCKYRGRGGVVVIPSGVTRLDADTFARPSARRITSVTIPNTVTTITGLTFSNCSSLRSLTIPRSVDTIKSGAFEDCRNLESITFEGNVQNLNINGELFDGCTKLREINANPEVLKYIYSYSAVARKLLKGKVGDFEQDYQDTWGDDDSASGNDSWQNRFRTAAEEMDDEELWDEFLAGPEQEIDEKLQVFPEPSVQGSVGTVSIFDEAEPPRWEDPIEVDYTDWTEKEYEMASSSKSEKEYAQKYEAYLKSLIPALRGAGRRVKR